ncbi:hypothetical protein [Helicobacter sp. MIT 01-3238]|uniref:hypothetical protein n=1 Tax=Helicobacter sp. MIT 01-3238 TaxID=398627 RepID=UPI000E1E5C45|nr:hypothetical protein [Helicobacter sp. MIT 01-3238]RDU52925.1 hypothetical protein CQA40_06390 [Helicobacter sp. MIT 01-3238]
MSPNTLRIFELCNELATLLSDKQAIADIKRLYEKHSEDKMFKDMEEVAQMIKEVAQKPEIITEAKTSNALLAAKRLNSEKMGDIVIVNNDGQNVIIHANKKRLSAFEKLRASLVETPTPSTHRDLPTEELIAQKDELSGANARSVNSDSNSTKESNQSQTTPKTRRMR